MLQAIQALLAPELLVACGACEGGQHRLSGMLECGAQSGTPETETPGAGGQCGVSK